MIYNFTPALIRNIERTYTYAYVSNKYQYAGAEKHYNPISFFEKSLETHNPFTIFMTLDGYAFKKTLNDLTRYHIPYTADEKRRAKVFFDVTEMMKKEKSDYVSLYVEDLENTGVTLYADPYILTTKDTIKVAKIIKSLPVNAKTDNVFYETKLDDRIAQSKEQMDAIKTCLENRISCLIGGAGTGKSFVTATIINQLLLNNKNVKVLAPTHKAKEALQEKMNENGIKLTVSTIHSFAYNNEKTTTHQVVVIDESGMLSTPLFKMIMQKYTDQQLIFVGDKNQIPPVEYGRPFELIQEHFTTSELKDNKRAESADIIALGREILGIPQNANMSHPNIEVVATTKEAFARGAEVVLTYTNSNVKLVNDERKIRNGKPTVSPHYSVDDLIIAKTNKNNWYNGQIFKITSPTTAINTKTKKTITFEDTKELEYNFDLAYGLTIHKSQGSEWDVVAYQPSELDTQNLAYVAVTRAKKKLIIVGDGIKEKYPADRKWRQLK